MQFNSFPYMVFLVVAVSVFWFLPPRLRPPFVLLASLAFYATWGAVFIAVPLLIATIVFFAGKQVSANPLKARQWMWLGISCVLFLLIFYKYRDFALVNFNAVLHWMAARPITFAKSIALPVGISFYTFEAIGYLVDVRQGRVKPMRFMSLCLFFLFWPNVLSGPIVRARELAPQLKFEQKFEPRFAFEGIDRLIWGLVQKNAIANVLGIWVDKGFHLGSSGPLSTVDGWFLAIAFGLQIYVDFAGYTNMAVGAARLLGVTLPENFRQPYHAATPADFWSRWHMTLSRWIRDYLFFPINSRWKGASIPLYTSLLGVMMAVGLWHGAGWNFILWGFMHGAYLVLYRMYESVRMTRPVLGSSRIISGAWRFFTLIAVTAAWVPFRSPNMQKAGSILFSMFLRFSAAREFSLPFYWITVGVALFCVVEPLLLRKLDELDELAGVNGPSLFRIVCRPLAYTVGFLLFMLFDEHNAQFIYSQF
jgi:D-alanyl-lipoteichoic acid acyltransferase DltB (MBOAT superfamily)